MSLAKVSGENRIGIKAPSGYFSNGDRQVLESQGAFFERIQWKDRGFIPQSKHALSVFSRIIAAKPVVEIYGDDNTDPSGNGGGSGNDTQRSRPNKSGDMLFQTDNPIT
jgi:hypothetical protein